MKQSQCSTMLSSLRKEICTWPVPNRNVCEKIVDDCSLLISSVLQQTNKVSHSTGEKCTSWYKIRLQQAIKSANLVDCFSYCRCWSPGKRIFPILWVEVDFSTWPLGPAISLKAVATREKGHFHHICCRLSYERVCFWAKSIWRIRRPPFFCRKRLILGLLGSNPLLWILQLCPKEKKRQSTDIPMHFVVFLSHAHYKKLERKKKCQSYVDD